MTMERQDEFTNWTAGRAKTADDDKTNEWLGKLDNERGSMRQQA